MNKNYRCVSSFPYGASFGPRKHSLLFCLMDAQFFLGLTFAGAKRPLVIRRSLAMTIPSLANIPTHVPALLIASMAYSTCTRYFIDKENPNGETR